jgi:hypothetical protein
MDSWAGKRGHAALACSVAPLMGGTGKCAGRMTLRNISRACGMPSSRHCETACGVTWQSSATAFVPPKPSMILFASIPVLKHA